MTTSLLILSTFCALLLFFSLFPKDVSAFHDDIGNNISLGNYHLKHERYYEAIKYYTKVLRSDPNNFDSLAGKGYALVGLQKYAEAIPYLDKALKIYSNNVSALYHMGHAFVGLQKYEQAMPYLDKALKIYPNNINVLYDKAVALEGLGKYHEAVFYYDKVLKIDQKFALTTKDLQVIHTYSH